MHFQISAGMTKVLLLPLWLMLSALFFLPAAAAPPSAVIGGQSYRHAGAIANELKCGFYRSGKNYAFLRGEDRFDFRPERANFKFNGINISGSFPVRQFKGGLYFSNTDRRKMLEVLFQPGRSVVCHRIGRIILDPGHGGHDRGASGRRSTEKNLVLKIAGRTAQILRKCGYNVVLTRRNDRLIPLNRRGIIANNARGDIFVSLHCNASSDRRVRGIETYCLTPAGAASTNQKKRSGSVFSGNRLDNNNFLLAYELHRAILARTGAADRGVKRGRFAVLRNLKMPGVLLELGFISSPAEERLLNDPNYQERLARGIASGIISYHRRLNGR